MKPINNLLILQAMAKGLNPNSLRNYAGVIGFIRGDFITTDGFTMLVFSPHKDDSSFPIPDADIVLKQDLLTESPVRFPNATDLILKFEPIINLTTNNLEIFSKLFFNADFKKSKMVLDTSYMTIGNQAGITLTD